MFVTSASVQHIQHLKTTLALIAIIAVVFWRLLLRALLAIAAAVLLIIIGLGAFLLLHGTPL